MAARSPPIEPTLYLKHNSGVTQDKLLISLTCALALALAHPGSADAQTAAEKKSAKKKAEAKKAAKAAPAAAIKPPTNPVELLQNFKIALTRQQLLTDSFYEDASLLRFFGAQQTRWFKLPRPFIKSGKVTGLAQVFQQPPSTQPVSIDVLYKFVTQGTQEKRRAMIGMDIRDTRLTIDAAQAVLGQQLKITNPYAKDDPDRARTPTPGDHPLGNRLISYDFDAPASTGTLSLMVNGDGTIANIIAVQEEKEWKLAPLVVVPKESQ